MEKIKSRESESHESYESYESYESQDESREKWRQINENLTLLNDERIQHWKKQDEQYAKIELIQTKINDLQKELNQEFLTLKQILKQSPVLYGLNLRVGNIINNTGNLTKP